MFGALPFVVQKYGETENPWSIEKGQDSGAFEIWVWRRISSFSCVQKVTKITFYQWRCQESEVGGGQSWRGGSRGGAPEAEKQHI